jgi:PAS domain S-box-containing protein
MFGSKSDNLKKTVRELENILNSISAPMLVTDKDLKIIRVNDAALNITGYRREEVVNKMTCANFAKTPL